MILFVIVLCLGTTTASSVNRVWRCSSDADCAGMPDRVCHDGDCVCPAGRQPTDGGLQCIFLAPYHTSECAEEYQCSRMVTSYECRRDEVEDETGSCLCQPGYHYYLSRCWPTKTFGESCNRSEECVRMGDVFSLTCDGVCTCAEGYVLRQSGDCRIIGSAPGDGCVLDQDCDFDNAECNPDTLRCQIRDAADAQSLTSNLSIRQTPLDSNITLSSSNQQLGQLCSASTPCAEHFECFFGTCICPRGYYAIADSSVCYAELGSPSTPEQCVGLFTEARDGICTCLTNFISDSNGRDCIKAARSLTDSCVSNANCYTYGPGARCGEPQQWQLRTCECDPQLAVWDQERNICRSFAGIGEACQVDSDCLVGGLQIQCIISDGQGVCTCPDGYVEVDGLCLTTGLSLGDSCQVSQECTETPNTQCENGRCSCDSRSFMEVDGVCLPKIGGICEVDDDCTIANTQCFANENGTASQCECVEGFVGYDNSCWNLSTGYEAECEVDLQCQRVIGQNSFCQNGTCQCEQDYHFRDRACWPITGLLQACRRTSECFLEGANERTVCRNSLCQCDFDFIFDEENQTCLSSAGHHIGSLILIKISLVLLFFK